MNYKHLFSLAIAFSLFTFVACSDDNDGTKGSVKVEITDAPIDDASVKGAFVTIAEVKVDGKTLEGFNKTTLDLMAYQNGRTELLIDADTEVKSYNQVSLILDYDQDANGNSPGCYVEDQDGTKYALETSGSGEITVNHSFEVAAEQSTNLLIDFDLRKSIQREDDANDPFDFVTEAELNGAVRVVNKSTTGTINGNCNTSSTSNDKVVVYAYKKGSYNRDTEVEGQGQSDVEFSNAVTSASVDASGNYELHFLESGEYELHYATYEENTSGEMELKGTLAVDVLTAIDLGAVSVDASASVTVNVIATAIIGL